MSSVFPTATARAEAEQATEAFVPAATQAVAQSAPSSSSAFPVAGLGAPVGLGPLLRCRGRAGPDPSPTWFLPQRARHSSGRRKAERWQWRAPRRPRPRTRWAAGC